MNRRGFFGALPALAAGVAVPQMVRPKVEEYRENPLRVERANGKAFIVGVATETIQAGDFVQIQTHGPATAKVV